MATKVCSKCGTEKDISEFHKDKSKKDRLTSLCKRCQKEYRHANREARAECQKKRYENNPEYMKECWKKYREANREAISERREKWKKNNPGYIENYKKEYRKSNKEAISEYMKKYQQTENGKDAGRKASHKRRALKRGATIEDFSPLEVFERDGYRCQTCGIKTSLRYKNQHHPKRSELDHIVPLSLGGEHSKVNAQCLCSHCNRVKHNTGTGDQMRMFG